ncbi:MAG TPA: hypothetical protein VNK23_02280 [Candidatus Dormibacteraeota bacterium]|nr:hypothetical protein [Candidatus Dormibacteraeota bacterium]
METTGRQSGTPSAARDAEIRAKRCPRERSRAVPLVCAFAILQLIFAAPLFAQSGQEQPWPDMSQFGFPQKSGWPQISADDSGVGDPSTTLASIDESTGMLPMMPMDNSRLLSAESCGTWTAASVNSPTVSVARLAVPGKARHQFLKACGAFKDHQLEQAESHVREAVKIYPQYAAAWVLLGQILEADHKENQAVEACRQGLAVDPKYAPPYMCLAGFAARANDWGEAYSLADHALSLDPATDPYAFLYTATADLHLKRYDQAELYGLSAEKLDKWNRIPDVHLLLAKLYEVKRKPIQEEKELREFIKAAPHNTVWELARIRLSELRDYLLK